MNSSIGSNSNNTPTRCFYSSENNVQSTEKQKPQVTFHEYLPSLKDGEKYLDQTKLLKGKKVTGKTIYAKGNKGQFKRVHLDFYLHQAIHLATLQKVHDPFLGRRLEMGILRGYSKTAKVGTDEADALGIQISPFAHRNDEYHRSSPGNLLIVKAHAAFADAMNLDYDDQDFRLVSSSLVTEVFDRHLPHPGLDLAIDSKEKFSELIDLLLNMAKKGEFPEHWVIADCSALFPQGTEPTDINILARELESIVLDKVTEFAKANSDVNISDLQNNVMAKFQIIAMTQFKGQNVMLMPKILDSPDKVNNSQKSFISKEMRVKHKQAMNDLREYITGSGFRLSPEQARSAWLSVSDLDTIIESADLFLTEFATSGIKIPEVATCCNDFVNSPLVGKFQSLSNEENAPPYLKVLPEATTRLLAGLATLNADDGGVDKFFNDNGISDILQTSYFRMAGAMQSAILYKKNQIAFSNAIEILHHEIQTILAIVEPYEAGDLEEAVISKMTSGETPMVPPGLNDPKVHLKSSGMRCIASVISGVERQKGTNQLNVVTLKDCYYETAGSKDYSLLDRAHAHSLSVLDGDRFNLGGIDSAFDNESFPKLPIDLFVCEFHHNISADRQHYTPENITEQVKAMAKKGMLADPCTILIDTTINLELSGDIRDFLNEPVIKELIKRGSLNVALVRSAQKFDMLGIDNYYGGISVCINNNEVLGAFNSRMDNKEDQLQDLSYQGITHLQKHAGDSIDKYRLGIMENTRKLYELLPKKCIFSQGTRNLMQISRIEDERTVFLDIKFPNLPKSANSFEKKLKEFALEEGLPFTTRASFGFANTNFTSIGEEKKRLSPGLESAQIMERYAAFFKAAQKSIDRVMRKEKKSVKHLDDKQTAAKLDVKLSIKLERMTVK